jgi:hypothetical protein
MFNTPSRKVFFALTRTVKAIDLDGESTTRTFKGSVVVEGVESAPCGKMADIYLTDGAVAFDVSMDGAVL